MDEPMVDSESDEEETDDEDDDGDVDNLRDRQGVLTRKMEEVSDTKATNSVAIEGIHPRVTALEEQTRGYLDAVHTVDGGAPHCFGEETSRTASGGTIVISLPFLPCYNYTNGMSTYTFLFLCRDRIMPPKQMSQAAIAKLIANEVKKALDANRATTLRAQ
ncbi:hypothetical protein Tco_0518214 [Tanacetum coccineum]